MYKEGHNLPEFSHIMVTTLVKFWGGGWSKLQQAETHLGLQSAMKWMCAVLGLVKI